MTNDTFTILLPVYGRSELLDKALESILGLKNREWQLIIADDGSDSETQGFLEKWLTDNKDSRVRWLKRPKNLGLFANLNQAIKDAETELLLLLCSDDLLKPTALDHLYKLRNDWPNTGLILSTFESINADGSGRPADSAWHHDQISRETNLIQPQKMLPALLRLGSINGNLTGMAFTRSLWIEAGPFREDWRHAADWEWLIRAVERGDVLLNRTPLAQIRTHAGQLSNSNRHSGHELQEVSSVISLLLEHPLLAAEPRRFAWGSHVMQFQLWNLIKGIHRRPIRATIQGFRSLHQTTGLRRSALAFMKTIPLRWQAIKHQGKPHWPTGQTKD